MEKEFVISELIDKVNVQLAVIGKVKKDGSFVDYVITTSKEPLMVQYFGEALKKVCTYCSPVMKGYQSLDNKFVILFESDGLGDVVYESVRDYLINYGICQYLSMMGVDVSNKYVTETEYCFASVVEECLRRVVKDSSSKLSETKGVCE